MIKECTDVYHPITPASCVPSSPTLPGDFCADDEMLTVLLSEADCVPPDSVKLDPISESDEKQRVPVKTIEECAEGVCEQKTDEKCADNLPEEKPSTLQCSKIMLTSITASPSALQVTPHQLVGGDSKLKSFIFMPPIKGIVRELIPVYPDWPPLGPLSPLLFPAYLF